MTRHSFLHIYKPILLLALDEYFRVPTLQTLADVFKAVNGMDLSSMPKLTQIERLVLLQSDRDDLYSERFPPGQRERSVSTTSQVSSASDKLDSILLEPITPLLSPPSPGIWRDTREYRTEILYNKTALPIAVPLTTLPEVVGDFSVIQLINTFSKTASQPQNFPLHPYLTTNGPNTHPLMVLLNALITQKRVVLLGQNQPSGQVASYVLAACAMASGGTGLLRGFTERSFPYTDLSKIDDLLTVDGFIAGVTNSVFSLHPEWWDILCNIDTGQVTISPNLDSHDSIVYTFETTDKDFLDDLLQAVADRNSESVIRLKFREWVNRFIKLAAAQEEIQHGQSDLHPPLAKSFTLLGHGLVWPDEASKKRELLANAARIDKWRGTDSYKYAIMDRKAQFARTSNRVRTFDLSHQLDRLRILKTLGTAESAAIYETLGQEIITDAHLTELLSLTPPNSGGITVLANGLFHPSIAARRGTVFLVDRLKEHSVGRHYYSNLNRYYRLAHERLVFEFDMDDTSS